MKTVLYTFFSIHRMCMKSKQFGCIINNIGVNNEFRHKKEISKTKGFGKY